MKQLISILLNSELRAQKSSVRDYYNKQLELIAKDCGIKTKVTFYIASHVFAGFLLRKDYEDTYFNRSFVISLLKFMSEILIR